jgi:hypothetical protein
MKIVFFDITASPKGVKMKSAKTMGKSFFFIFRDARIPLADTSASFFHNHPIEMDFCRSWLLDPHRKALARRHFTDIENLTGH